MENNITKEFLQEYFRKHNSLTLYKADGTPVVITKQYNYAMVGGCHRFQFKDYDNLKLFYKKYRLCLEPVIKVD